MIIRRKSEQPSCQPSPPPPPPLDFSVEEELGSESKLIVPENSTAAKDTAAEEDAKKPKKFTYNNLNRIWSEEDEIIILKGLIDYASQKKSDPSSDPNAFHDFIKKDLQVDASRNQLVSKIQELRRKYITNNRGQKRRTFSKSHDRKLCDLAKLIWGKKATGRAASEEVAHAAESGEKLMSVEERTLRVGREVYEQGEGGVEWEKEWEKLRAEELEVYRKELEVKAAQSKVRIAQTKLVLEAIKRRRTPFSS